MGESRKQARQLAKDSVGRGDVDGWFENLYQTAQGDATVVPWADQMVNPNLAAWLKGPHAAGAGRKALVVGCGLGDDAEELARRGYRVTAFDLSPRAIEWCRQRHPDSKVDYQVADLLAPPNGWRGAFDLVVEIYTLQTLPAERHASAAQCLARLVAPRGALLIITRGRLASEPPGNMPWPLTQEQLQAAFGKLGLREVLAEHYVDDEDPPVRRFRVEYRQRVEILDGHGQPRLGQARELFREYAAELALDLEYQGFEKELAALPGRYAPPEGRLLLAICDRELAGCVAVGKLDEPGVCEMKRLYVRPDFRRDGIGRRLAEDALAVAREAGYRAMWLDMHPAFGAAAKLYRGLGFVDIAPYGDGAESDLVLCYLGREL